MTVLHFFHLKKFLKFWIIFLKSKKKSERGKQFKRDKEERCFFFCNFFWNKLVTREKYLTKNCQLNWKSGRFSANKKISVIFVNPTFISDFARDPRIVRFFSQKTRGTFSSFAAMLSISTDSRFYSSLISAD